MVDPMTVDRPTARPAASLPSLAVLIALLALFAGIAGYFATVQDLWTDETTQLAGSALPLGRMMRWLVGGEALGVPGDRMPPLSYFLDGLCQRTLCTQPIHFRFVHLLAVTAGIALLLRITLRRHGISPMVIVGLFLAFSSTLINEAVEIRSYPWFFVATCLQLWAFDRAFRQGRLASGVSGAFALASVVSIHAHFFGLVASGALFLGLAAGLVRTRRDMVHAAPVAAVIVVAAAGLIPFVIGATAISGSPDIVEPSNAHDVGRYLLRLTSFPSMLIYPVTAILFFAGLATLLAIALLRDTPSDLATLKRAWPMQRALALVLLAGLAVTAAASFVVSGFYPLKVSYSLWTLPVIALLLGGACDVRGRAVWLRRMAGVGAILLIGGSFASQWVLIAHSRWFTHGTMREIAGEFAVPPSRVAVLYVGANWATAYFPLLYRYGTSLEQRMVDGNGNAFAIQPGGDVVLYGRPFDASRFDQVLLVTLNNATYREIRGLKGGRIPSALQTFTNPPPPLTTGAWRVARRVVSPGLYWLRMVDLRRTHADTALAR